MFCFVGIEHAFPNDNDLSISDVKIAFIVQIHPEGSHTKGKDVIWPRSLSSSNSTTELLSSSNSISESLTPSDSSSKSIPSSGGKGVHPVQLLKLQQTAVFSKTGDVELAHFLIYKLSKRKRRDTPYAHSCGPRERDLGSSSLQDGRR